ncbi:MULTISPECIES: hypothetical protein [Pseudofrankia]|uniref:hypothetical protein n=1 Tax=Pseudofrankia TaxID=2994363 RepID=UPI0018E2E331|nr:MULTISPECIES: hypothetical protein [Pseudofrankia]
MGAACTANEGAADFALAEIRELIAVHERHRDLAKITVGLRLPTDRKPLGMDRPGPARLIGLWRHGRAASINSGVNRCTHRKIVT